MKKGEVVNGIAIISDGGENCNPYFHGVYPKYCAQTGMDIPVYMFHVGGMYNEFHRFTENAGINVETFKLGRNVDYYSLPNLIRTLRTSRYTLVEEIMETKLLTFNDVFK